MLPIILAFKTYCLQENHSISFDFTACLKAPRKFVRNVYDCAKGDFEGLWYNVVHVHTVIQHIQLPA